MSLTITNLSKAKKSQIIKNTAIVLSIPLVLTLVFKHMVCFIICFVFSN